MHVFMILIQYVTSMHSKTKGEGKDKVNDKLTGGNKVGLTVRMGIKTRAIVVNTGSRVRLAGDK